MEEEFTPLFLKPCKRKLTLRERFGHLLDNFIGLALYDEYLELERQLAQRMSFPRDLWESRFGEIAQQIECACHGLRDQWHCWRHPFFIPEDPLDLVLLGGGNYECYYPLIASVEHTVGVHLTDAEMDKMLTAQYTLGAFFQFAIRKQDT